MDSRARLYLLTVIKLFDASVMMLGFFISVILSRGLEDLDSLHKIITLRLEVINFIIFILWLFLWNESFSYYRLYNFRRIYHHWVSSLLDVLKAVSFGTVIMWTTAVIFNIELITPYFVGVFWLIVCSVIVSSRVIIGYLLRCIRRWGRNLRYVLIVGTNSKAIKLAERIHRDKESGYVLVGFVDEPWEKYKGPFKEKYSIVANYDSFQGYIKHHAIDEVIICIPIKSFYEKVSSIFSQCEEQGITVRFVTDIVTPKIGRLRSYQFGGYNAVTIVTGKIEGQAKAMKHIIDFILSAALLVILSPFFLFIALFIKIDSPGQIFFKQERIGLNKRRFHVYKFRTMVVDAEKAQAELNSLNELSGPVFKIKNDPRITAVGKILRKTSIDELPQLINVIRGEMSLVGPRPLPVRDYNGFEQDSYRRRLSVRPGITCLWQVEGRNSIPFEKWMELDLQYIDHWSLSLDLLILLKTIPAVVRGTGAS
jgi:exopolysaccharide biosynthesis polyprenyl glycosylphosphotransferase